MGEFLLAISVIALIILLYIIKRKSDNEKNYLAKLARNMYRNSRYEKHKQAYNLLPKRNHLNQLKHNNLYSRYNNNSMSLNSSSFNNTNITNNSSLYEETPSFIITTPTQNQHSKGVERMERIEYDKNLLPNYYFNNNKKLSILTPTPEADKIRSKIGNLNNNVTLNSGLADTEVYFKIPFGNIYDGAGAIIGTNKTFTFDYTGITKSITMQSNGSLIENN